MKHLPIDPVFFFNCENIFHSLSIKALKDIFFFFDIRKLDFSKKAVGSFCAESNCLDYVEVDSVAV